jgi:hypothetical protein
MTIEGGRDTPNAAVAVGPFFHLVKIVLFDAVRRVGDDRMETVLRDTPQPLEAIGMNH